ncbi:MAG: pyridoxal-phosphate dependent enzyme [Roseitalea sp.]|jgi:threonine synthase|nr:pyridoxal-phosphate dependent enzyme [Roseitalea sp.]MBO6721072.1 pyridoxal-phosphate dependent enzyme [Roseitalea sp.]MBO6742856.1 pyridoxal-phosphate dependent enzyme [Roseitalea sp.]
MRPVYSGLSFNPKDATDFSDWLAYPDHPRLGQGNTPVVELPRLAAALGVSTLSVKIEGANPTGSHKDRMSALAVARALDIGAQTVVAASSGNAGASIAAYCGAVGLKCVIVTTSKMNPNWRRAIEFHGARLEYAPSVQARWHLVEERTRKGEWYPVTNFCMPAVGSNPFGVDGYRTVSFEIYRQCNPLPTDILVPTSRGDLLWGLARGFADLEAAGCIDHSPKLHAIEPFPRITRVLEGSDYRDSFPGESAMTSLGGSTVCFQALKALDLSGGTALPVEQSDVKDDQRLLARNGLYLELSCAAALTGLRKAARNEVVKADARVMLIGTSHGYKEIPEVMQ